MPELWLAAAMALVLLAFTGLVGVGQRVLGKGLHEGEAPAPGSWPPLTLIVPVAGAPWGLARRLTAILNQDYPDYEVIFAVRDLNDPAAPVILSLPPGKGRTRLVVAGPARTCGQKNHNLLAGVRLAGHRPAILAFCDSNQEAPPDFLRHLAAPLVKGEGPVTSGYHHVLPQDHRLPSWGRAVATLTLYLTKATPSLNQPWGGATAIRREFFDSIGVARLWAETVVDDVSLAALLIRRNQPVCLSRNADLATPLAGETWSSWQSWLFRQWIYLKYYLPGSWLAAGLFLHLATFLTLFSTVSVFLGLGGVGFYGGGFLCPLFLLGLVPLALALRGLHPQPPGRLRWLAACLAALLMGSYVHFKTCLTQKITWRGLVYEVDWRGRVKSIRTSAS